MKPLAFLLLNLLTIMSYAQDTPNEKVVKAYYEGFEDHNWNEVVSQFAEGFTFTSPNNDDHIPLETFKERCWPTNAFFKKVNYIKMVESGNDLMLLVEIITTDGKAIRNVDVFTMSAGKIKSIEVFFGPGAWYPGNKK